MKRAAEHQDNRGRGVQPEPEIVAALRERVAKSTSDRVARDLGVSRGVVERILAGTGVRTANVALVTLKLGATKGPSDAP